MSLLNDQFKQLKALFYAPEPISDSPVEIRFASFEQNITDKKIEDCQKSFSRAGFIEYSDDQVRENISFKYPIFIPKNRSTSNSAIILFHGLNERNWEKYLCWASRLAANTGKCVILFPIAFHINRSPSLWSNPRSMMQWASERKKRCDNPSNLSFVNMALSERLTDDPLRFYIAGKETVYNIRQLAYDIKSGNHPFFEANCHLDIFAYSIGALLSQVILMSNPDNLFTDSKLFMFCGGSIFNRMNGSSRFIMDNKAYSRIMDFYQNQFLLHSPDWKDQIDIAFKSLIDTDIMRNWRQNFFLNATDRIKVISLKKDTVIPTDGIRAALGEECASKCLSEWDFPFPYSHEVPFPIEKNNVEHMDECFGKLFAIAGAFLK